eukprot:352012-Chlamydomonas_euryale.AAC.3
MAQCVTLWRPPRPHSTQRAQQLLPGGSAQRLQQCDSAQQLPRGELRQQNRSKQVSQRAQFRVSQRAQFRESQRAQFIESLGATQRELLRQLAFICTRGRHQSYTRVAVCVGYYAVQNAADSSLVLSREHHCR